MTLKALSPRGEIDPIETIGLQPRVTDLNGKTIGLFAGFKEHWVLILEEIGRQLKEKYPDAEFRRFQYTKDLNSYTQVAEVAKDPEVRPVFEEWLEKVDTVITANGDAGSCALYLTYNTTLVEKLGKPVVMTLHKQFIKISKSAAALRGVPGLRYVELDIPELSGQPSLEIFINEVIPECVKDVLDDIVEALTGPLTEEEKTPETTAEDLPRIVCEGNFKQVNNFFYKNGWSYGMPIVPPTEEEVEEMLKGTDLPPDHVVAKIPPMMGKASVEKIAVNAVMAGCLPTYMPVLIAAVEALTDPRMWLEAYTCSLASWAPLLIINGPVRRDLGVNSGATLLSPYHKANAAIANAIGLIIMNIAGVRPGIEDMATFGHEGRFGICIAENEDASPWKPLHEFYGLDRNDSAVTVFWPNSRYMGTGARTVEGVLKGICEEIPAFGFDPGCAVIMRPNTARLLHGSGYSRKDVIDYIVEYARRPASEINVRWMKGNHHQPRDVSLPADASRSARKFFSGMHLPVVVAGMDYGFGMLFYGGGGDHGGPVTKKINLPQNWGRLVTEYEDITPAVFHEKEG